MNKTILSMMAILLTLSMIMSVSVACSCEVIDKKKVKLYPEMPNPADCPDGEWVLETTCKKVPVYPIYYSVYAVHVMPDYVQKFVVICSFEWVCVPYDVEEKVDVPTPHNNFPPSMPCEETRYSYFMNGEHYCTTEEPTNPDGPVIVTPGGFVEAIQSYDFAGSAKGKRIALWRANHA